MKTDELSHGRLVPGGEVPDENLDSYLQEKMGYCQFSTWGDAVVSVKLYETQKAGEHETHKAGERIIRYLAITKLGTHARIVLCDDLFDMMAHVQTTLDFIRAHGETGARNYEEGQAFGKKVE